MRCGCKHGCFHQEYPDATRQRFCRKFVEQSNSRNEKGQQMGNVETDARAESVQKGFRITLEQIRERIASVEYIHRKTLTVCIIELDNGWFAVGESAPVDPNNYGEETGNFFAYEAAERKFWPLLAFAHLENASAPLTEVSAE